MQCRKENAVLEILKEFPDNVVAAKGSGEVTKKDYEDVLIPAVAAALKRHDKIRCFYMLDKEFSGFDAGAVWEDTKIGFEHLTRWERVAVVTDVEWIRLTINFFHFLFPIRVFSVSEEAEARKWIES